MFLLFPNLLCCVLSQRVFYLRQGALLSKEAFSEDHIIRMKDFFFFFKDDSELLCFIWEEDRSKPFCLPGWPSPPPSSPVPPSSSPRPWCAAAAAPPQSASPSRNAGSLSLATLWTFWGEGGGWKPNREQLNITGCAPCSPWSASSDLVPWNEGSELEGVVGWSEAWNKHIKLTNEIPYCHIEMSGNFVVVALTFLLWYEPAGKRLRF